MRVELWQSVLAEAILLAVASSIAFLWCRLDRSRLAGVGQRALAARPRLRRSLRFVGRTTAIAALACVIAVPVAGASGALAGTTIPYHGSDMLEFNAPQGGGCVSEREPEGRHISLQCGEGLYYGRYPWSAYSLDQHIEQIDLNPLKLEIGGIAELVLFTVASLVWRFTLLLVELALLVFGFAFNLNLFTRAHGGFALLGPAVHASHTLLKSSVGFGQLIAIAFTGVGLYALWGSVVRQRHMRTFAQVGTSLAIFGIATAIVTVPQATIGKVANITNDLTESVLALPDELGSTALKTTSPEAFAYAPGQMALAGQDAIFKMTVFEPFEVLDFGGTEHCARHVGGAVESHSCPVPKGAEWAKVNNERYARWFLETGNPRCTAQIWWAVRYVETYNKPPPASAEGENINCVLANGALAPEPWRHPAAKLKTLEAAGGESKQGLRSDMMLAIAGAGGKEGVEKAAPTEALQQLLHLGWKDVPVVDAQLNASQGSRVAVTFLVLIGDLAVVLLLLGLSAGVLVAALQVLFELIILPFVLLVGLFPGRGHGLFFRWLKSILSALVRKFIYAIVLAALLLIEFSIVGSSRVMHFGWLFGYVLMIAVAWMVLLRRHQLVGMFNQAVTGSTEGSQVPEPVGGVRRAVAPAAEMVVGAYLGSRLARVGTRKNRADGEDESGGEGSGQEQPPPNPPASPPAGSQGGRGSSTGPASNGASGAANGSTATLEYELPRSRNTGHNLHRVQLAPRGDHHQPDGGARPDGAGGPPDLPDTSRSANGGTTTTATTGRTASTGTANGRGGTQRAGDQRPEGAKGERERIGEQARQARENYERRYGTPPPLPGDEPPPRTSRQPDEQDRGDRRAASPSSTGTTGTQQRPQDDGARRQAEAEDARQRLHEAADRQRAQDARARTHDRAARELADENPASPPPSPPSRPGEAPPAASDPPSRQPDERDRGDRRAASPSSTGTTGRQQRPQDDGARRQAEAEDARQRLREASGRMPRQATEQQASGQAPAPPPRPSSGVPSPPPSRPASPPPPPQGE